MKELNLKTKIIIISAAAVVVAVLICVTAIAYNNKIYNGISVSGVNLSGKSVESATALLKGTEFFNTLPEFVYEDKTFTVEPEDIDLKCDAEKTAQLAWEYGRDKNIFKRIGNIFNLMFKPVNLDVEVAYNKEALNKIFNENLGDFTIPIVEPEIRLEANRLYIRNGSQGLEVAEQKLNSDLSAAALGKADKIELVVETVNPTAVSAESLYKEYAKEAVNAEYTIENMRINYKESQDGIEFDVAEAEQIIKDNLKNAEEYYIPVTVKKAEITVAQIEKTMFGDCLGTYTSKYNPGEVGRTKNVTLAAKRISNIVLKKDDIFSYNKIVGERTEERGFSNAKVYSGGEVVDGLGGGICQVSSTLYNAVLYADLDIVERANHTLPVAYVPLGRDATVVYGSIDFRFKNPYENPIKIVSSIGGGVLTISVYGKKETDKTVEITTERVSTYPFSVKEEVNETLLEGQTKVKQAGSDGAAVNTYKKIIENGKVVSNKFLHKSVYSPINKVVLVPPLIDEPEPTDNTGDSEMSHNVQTDADVAVGSEAPVTDVILTEPIDDPSDTDILDKTEKTEPEAKEPVSESSVPDEGDAPASSDETTLSTQENENVQ